MSKKYNWSDLGLNFGNWEEEKIWALDLPVTEIDMKDLIWHFDAPFWPNDNGERWTVTPWDVINQAPDTKKEQTNLEKADTNYPIDILENNGRWLILDGIHRLAKLYKQNNKKIKVRIIPRNRLPEILTGDPIELPEN